MFDLMPLEDSWTVKVEGRCIEAIGQRVRDIAPREMKGYTCTRSRSVDIPIAKWR